MLLDKTYRLRWENISTELDLLSSFRGLRENGTFFDVSLSCSDGYGGGKTIRAHKVILSAYSSVFNEMLSRHPNQNDPMVYLQGISYEVAEKLLEFMYKGEVNVSESGLAKFMDIAEDLKIKGLKSKKDKDPMGRFPRNGSLDPVDRLQRLQNDDLLDRFRQKSLKLPSLLSSVDELDPRPPIRIKPDLGSSLFRSSLSNDLDLNIKSEMSELATRMQKEYDEDIKPFNNTAQHNTIIQSSQNEFDDFVPDPELHAPLVDLYAKIDKISVRPDGRKTYYSRCKLCGKDGRTDDVRKHIRRSHTSHITDENGNKEVKSETSSIKINGDKSIEDPIDTQVDGFYDEDSFQLGNDDTNKMAENNTDNENSNRPETEINSSLVGRLEELLEKTDAFIPKPGGGKRYKGRCKICGKEARFDEARNHVRRHHAANIIE